MDLIEYFPLSKRWPSPQAIMPTQTWPGTQISTTKHNSIDPALASLPNTTELKFKAISVASS
jgi:hypothetical protein